MDKLVADIRASEAEVVQDFGKFELLKGSLYYPNTTIHYGDFYISSGVDGKIHIRSKKHNRTLTFNGAGGRECS